MKLLIQKIFYLSLFFILPLMSIAQTSVPLGAAESFVLFTSNGAMGNIGISQITGNVGTNVGSSTGFGNINGQFHDGTPTSIAAAANLGAAFTQLGLQATTVSLNVLMGSGQILVPAVYETLALTTLSGNLILDGQNLPNPTFVFKINAAMNVDPSAKIILINGAQACNIFWKINGALNTGTNVTLKGNFICDGAIGLTAGNRLEGRALSISGAVAVSGVTASMPLGCGVALPEGPLLPSLGDAGCFALLTGVGALTNVGVSQIAGHVGTNNGPVSGFNPLLVDSIHYVPDSMTAKGTASITTLHTTLLAMPCDITLTQPSLFGRSQVLTPHVYCLSAATQMTDTIFLDAQGVVDAVFVIKINGAFTTATFSNVVLRGGTKSSNVFWVVEGLVTVLDFSNFVGTIVANNGAITLTGANLDGRAYGTNGAISTSDVDITIPSVAPSISITGNQSFCEGDSAILTASASSSYLWSTGEITQSITVDTSGTYSVFATSICGSSDTSNSITIVVKPSTNSSVNASICDGDSILLGGIYRKIPGIYTDSLLNSALCDSIIRTDLSVNPKFITNFNAVICDGDSLLIAGVYRKIPGLYSDTLQSQFTCDSIVNINLSINPVLITNLNTSICDGDSILIAGIYRKLPGLYSDTLQGQLICDSIVNTNLNVNPIIITNLNFTICDGDSILLAGFYRKVAGIYSDTLQGQFTCDSIVNSNLSLNALPNADAGIDRVITVGQSVLIGTPAEIGNTYEWLPIAGLDFSNLAEVQSAALVNTTYYLTVTNTSTNCQSYDTVQVTVNPVLDLEFFNGFSPNGDALNDYWRIPVLSYYPENKVTIINRWGNEVWVTNNYDNNSNVFIGKNMNGEDLPDGTYYYIIEYIGVEKRGWVFIKR